MQSRPYRQVDVFTGTPYLGNPLAVVLDGTGLSDAQMQSFARWTNLSETTFILPPTHPQADYKVRIYTPGAEMRFAGHPTLGSCHAWLEAGGKPHNPKSIVQECGVGLVQIRRGAGDHLAFGAPPLKQSAPSATLLARVARAVGLRSPQIITARTLDNGTAWLGLLLDDPATVLQLTPDFPQLAGLGTKVGVAALRPTDGDDEATLEVRAFAPHMGINEDPVTGSLNASMAQWLIAEGHAPAKYVALQGASLQRAGHVFVERDADGQVWIGGQAVSCISGHVVL